MVCWWRQPSVGVAVHTGPQPGMRRLTAAGKVLPSGLDHLLDRATTHTLCCFSIALLRYSSCTMHFTYLKCAVEWFWYFTLFILKSYAEICILNLSSSQRGQDGALGEAFPGETWSRETACRVRGPAHSTRGPVSPES